MKTTGTWEYRKWAQSNKLRLKKKELQKSTQDERENYPKPNYIAEITSKWLTPDLFSLEDTRDHS